MGSYLTTTKAQLFKLSIEYSEIELLQPLTCGRGRLSPHNFAFSLKILHAQCTLSLLELSPSGCHTKHWAGGKCVMREDGDDSATPGAGVECAIDVAIASSVPHL